MTDPHIDIDDVDNPDSNFNNNDAGDSNAKGGTENSFGFNPNFTEFATGLYNFVERLRNQAGAGMSSSFDPLPYESRKHFRNSQREFLLGWRTLIDDAIRRLDERETRETVRQKNAPSGQYERAVNTKIEVEEIED